MGCASLRWSGWRAICKYCKWANCPIYAMVGYPNPALSPRESLPIYLFWFHPVLLFRWRCQSWKNCVPVTLQPPTASTLHRQQLPPHWSLCPHLGLYWLLKAAFCATILHLVSTPHTAHGLSGRLWGAGGQAHFWRITSLSDTKEESPWFDACGGYQDDFTSARKAAKKAWRC